MNTLDTLETLLAQYELYEPELGSKFRTSPHILMLGLGRAQLAAWEATSLTYLYGPSNTETFNYLVQALSLPGPLQATLLRQAQATRYDYYWMNDSWERVENLQLDGPHLRLRYANRKGRYLLDVEMPRLAASEREAAFRWLSASAVLGEIARGNPLNPDALARLKLVPPWSACKVGLTTKTQAALELGIKFLCRALTVYPAYLLILRGLSGEAMVRECVETELRQRAQAFEAAAAMLPTAPAEFWSAPEVLNLPLPHEVPPQPGLGAHLPPVTFWPRPEDNALLADVLAKVYKNIPRKLSKLTEPRRW